MADDGVCVKFFLVLFIAGITDEEFDLYEIFFFLVKFLGVQDPGCLPSSSASRSLALLFFIYLNLLKYSCLDHM